MVLKRQSGLHSGHTEQRWFSWLKHFENEKAAHWRLRALRSQQTVGLRQGKKWGVGDESAERAWHDLPSGRGALII